MFIDTVVDSRWLDYMDQCRISLELRMFPSMGDIHGSRQFYVIKSRTDLGLYENFRPLLTSLFFRPRDLTRPSVGERVPKICGTLRRWLEPVQRAGPTS